MTTESFSSWRRNGKMKFSHILTARVGTALIMMGFLLSSILQNQGSLVTVESQLADAASNTSRLRFCFTVPPPPLPCHPLDIRMIRGVCKWNIDSSKGDQLHEAGFVILLMH